MLLCHVSVWWRGVFPSGGSRLCCMSCGRGKLQSQLPSSFKHEEERSDMNMERGRTAEKKKSQKIAFWRGGGGLVGERHSEQLNFGGSSSGCSKKSNISTLKKSSVLTFPQLTLETIRRNKNLLDYSNIKKIIHKKTASPLQLKSSCEEPQASAALEKEFRSAQLCPHLFLFSQPHCWHAHSRRDRQVRSEPAGGEADSRFTQGDLREGWKWGRRSSHSKWVEEITEEC